MSSRKQILNCRRVDDVDRGRPVHIHFNGRQIQAYEGETVGAALWAANERHLRRTHRRDEPRGLFCGMGVCFDCLVRIDGMDNCQACLTPVREGMVIQTQPGYVELSVDP